MLSKISVCIATYNGEKFIKCQLDSILKQLSKMDEIIISDDYSTDKTIDIIKKYNDKRIKIYYNEKERGYTNNFENALSKAKGKYIFLADQDDKWYEDKVKKIMNYLETKKYNMVISDAEVVNENLEKIRDSFFKNRGRVNKTFFSVLLKANYLGCCMAFDKKVLEKALPFPKKKKYSPHDLWLGLIGFKFFKVKIISEPLIFYRRHGKNVSSGGEKSKSKLAFKIKFRAYNLMNLFKRSIR